MKKILYLQLMILGILSSLFSCTTQVDGRYIVEYNFINKTGSDVFLESFDYNMSSSGNDTILKYVYNLRNDSVLIQSIDIVIGDVAGTIALSDSLSITFDGNNCIQFLPSDTISPFNILNSSNFEIEKVHDNYERLT